MRSARGGLGLLRWPADSRTLFHLIMMMLLLYTRIGFVHSQGSPPEIIEHKREYILKVGQTMKLTCPIISGNMAMTYYQWEKGEGNQIGDFHPRFKVLKRGSGRILKSKKGVQTEDRGIYKCIGINGFGKKEVSLIVNVIDPNAPIRPQQCALVNGVRVKGAPCFIDMDLMKPNKITKEVGETVTMSCSAHGKSLQYSWKKDSNTAGWITSAEGFDTSMFTIRKLQLKHSGRYTCTVKNQLGILNYRYMLVVKLPKSLYPTILGSPKRNVTVDIGQTAQLMCSVRSHSKPYIRWMKKMDPSKRDSYKGAKYVRPTEIEELRDNFYKVLTESITTKDEAGIYVSELVVRKVSGKDIGEYVCVVFGAGGTDYRNNFIFQTLYLHIRNYRYTGQPGSDGSMGVNAANPFHLIVYIAVPLLVLVVCIGVIIYCLVTRHNTSMSARGTNANSGSRLGSNSGTGYVMKPYSNAQTKYTAQPVPQYEPYPLPNSALPSPPAACYPSYHSSSSNGYSASSAGPIPGRAYNA